MIGIIKDVLEYFKDANLHSDSAREGIAKEIIKRLDETTKTDYVYSRDLIDDSKLSKDDPTVVINANSAYNDGFTQKYYKDILDEKDDEEYKGGHLGLGGGKVIIKKLDTGVLVKYDVSERIFDIVKEDDEMLIFNYVNHWTDETDKELFSSLDIRMINKVNKIYTHFIVSDKSPEYPIEYGVTTYDGTCLKDE